MPKRSPELSNDRPLIGAVVAGPPVRLAKVLDAPFDELKFDNWPLDWLPEKKIAPDELIAMPSPCVLATPEGPTSAATPVDLLIV